MKHNIYKRNFWTGETTFISTADNSFTACNICDKYNFDRKRADYSDAYYYFEPVGGWKEARAV